METPCVITASKLYARLVEDRELTNGVLALREAAATLAATISRTVPAFTDHTIRHMDALWSVTERILTTAEIDDLSQAEVFVLASGFYLHDIGMAYAATDEGLARIQTSPSYAGFLANIPPSLHSDPAMKARAVAQAVRTIHAAAAIDLATTTVPGTDIYLFDSRVMREQWAETCGRIAASHHWNMERIDKEFGSQGVVPLPNNRKGDLGYVASILRLADYAHINRDRACPVERAFRIPIERDSLIHWLAQENIDGPERDGGDLIYRAAKPISDVDAWWLYFGMLKGLDEEIRSVRRYLDRRASSQGRLSLQGVRGVSSPEEASVFIPTAGFLPIEVNLRTGSIERLVQLLAGESLYGPDPMAAVRELIQNSRDAVMLKAAVASTDFDRATLSIPIRLALKTQSSPPRLEIIDPGIGMTAKVMTDYLISIASDYWISQFHTDFPAAQSKGFRPAGRFGIGFLSVFMLGDEVKVESNRDGGERHILYLRGVGRRGEIRMATGPSGSGTAVRIDLRQSVMDSLRPLNELVKVYAPMLSHSMEVDVDGEKTSIPTGWLHQLDIKEFHKWTLQAIGMLTRSRHEKHRHGREFGLWYARRRYAMMGSESRQDSNWLRGWPEFSNEHVRLVASFDGHSLLCLRGLAIQPIPTPGFVGVIDLESGTLDVSRRQAINADVSDVLNRATEQTKPHIVENINALADEGLLIDKLEFLSTCVSLYGRQTILEASVPWISLLRLPGEVKLISCTTLLESLTKASSLFIAYGTGPWTAMKKWVNLKPHSIKSDPAVVLDDSPMDRLSYYSGNEEKVGQLIELWPACVDAPLFGTILRLAAEAWQVNVEELAKQEGWRHRGSEVWGCLARP
jgi:hypothetical protein